MKFEPIDNQTLRNRIALRIREAILTGELTEGERLVERRLAQEFGASISAVREALIELETAGFIAKLPNLSTHVIKISQEDARKITSVREVLEGFAVSELMPNLNADVEEVLAALVHEQIESAEGRDGRRCLQMDLAFHEELWKLTRNEHLENSLRRIVLPFYAFLSIRLRTADADRLRECAEANLPLLAALSARDAVWAKRAVEFAAQKWLETALGAPIPLAGTAKVSSQATPGRATA